MLERYDVIISEGAPDPMLPQVEGDWVRYADAHEATIADLQGQVKLANIDQANVEAERNDLQQRVDQLEGELQEYIQAATNEPINEPLTYGALKAARFVAKRAFAELTKLQADHARVLGLVRKIVPSIVVATRNYTVRCYCGDKNVPCKAHAKYYVDRAAVAVLDELLEAASLPAQPAQGGA